MNSFERGEKCIDAATLEQIMLGSETGVSKTAELVLHAAGCERCMVAMEPYGMKADESLDFKAPTESSLYQS